MKKDYTEKNALAIIGGLIDGSIEPVEAALWADEVENPVNSAVVLKIQADNPALYQLISDIGLASALDGKHELLYGSEDFQGWRDEYLNAHSTDISRSGKHG